MLDPLWSIEFGDGPIVAAAIHDGHFVRAKVAALLRLDDAARLYEEDPFTAVWTLAGATRVVGRRSRFEFDLNRPREKAVYLHRDDAWGLDVWRSPPSPALLAELHDDYDEFYGQLRNVLQRLLTRHRHVVVLDLHSYNHRRAGAERPPADPRENPEINLGTASLERSYWAPIVDRLLAELRAHDFLGRRLDARENVRFQGGHMVQWIHANFPRQVCGLAIEVKKFFMDEWTSQADEPVLAAVGSALARAASGVGSELENFRDGRRTR